MTPLELICDELSVEFVRIDAELNETQTDEHQIGEEQRIAAGLDGDRAGAGDRVVERGDRIAGDDDVAGVVDFAVRCWWHRGRN